ncbi:HepT-like ribonuclease domain-containing protein [Runella slithyformis]
MSTQLKDEYNTVSWKQVKGLPNRIAQDYTGIDYEVVFHIVQHDLPDLKF